MRVRPNPFLETQGYRFGSLVIVARDSVPEWRSGASWSDVCGQTRDENFATYSPPSPGLLDGVV